MIEENEEIDLLEIVKLLWEGKLIIVLFTLFATVAALVVSTTLLEEKYETTTSLFVGTDESINDNLSMSDLQVSSQLIEDYKEVIKTRAVAEEVMDTLDLDISYSEYLNNIQVTSKQNSRFIYITYEDSSPVKTALITNQIAETFIEKVDGIVGDHNIKVIDVAPVPNKPSSPNIVLNVCIGAIIGLIIGVLIILLRNALDNTIKKEEDIEKKLELTVLGVIPTFDGEKRG